MGSYVQRGQVRTWYDDHGDGQPLVLLHPGGAARAWAPNLAPLAADFHVYTPERRGHGRTPDVEGPITYELVGQDTIAFLERVVGGPPHLVGHSAGANVALVVALRRPDLARRVVLISGVFHRDGWIPEVIDPDRELNPALAHGYAELSPDGIDHFAVVGAKLKRMDFEEPTLQAAELRGLLNRTLVMVADDEEVTLEHTVEMYRSLPDAELAVIPGTSHGLLHENRACATPSSGSSSPRTRFRRSRQSAARRDPEPAGQGCRPKVRCDHPLRPRHEVSRAVPSSPARRGKRASGRRSPVHSWCP